MAFVRLRRFAFALSLVCILLAFTAASQATTDSAVSAQPSLTGQHYIRTVFLVVMENHNWTGSPYNIKASYHAPYINYTLLPQASHTQRYYNPPHNHPSLPNYLWIEAGTNFGILKDGPPTQLSQTTQEHLVSLLDKAGISWRSYEEGITGTQCPLVNWHDPFVFFDDVTNRKDPSSAKCIAHVRPYSELAGDLANNKVARYNLIVPNLCHSMHNTCNGNAIEHGDAWLAANVPAILNSDAYRQGGALFVTWDEALWGDGPIPMLVLSPFAKGNGYTNDLYYTHGSLLHTLQNIFGVGPLLRNAANQRDLRDLFTVFP